MAILILNEILYVWVSLVVEKPPFPHNFLMCCCCVEITLLSCAMRPGKVVLHSVGMFGDLN